MFYYYKKLNYDINDLISPAISAADIQYITPGQSQDIYFIKLLCTIYDKRSII